MNKLLLLIAISVMSVTAMAQSPFKAMPSPYKLMQMKAAKNGYSLELTNLTLVNAPIVSYRFTLPFAGFSPITKQISTGLGYGYNKMHYVDSTQRYYTDLSIYAAIFLNGDLTPSPYNFTSVGVGVGILNDLIMITPAYNLPTLTYPKGAFDLKISLGLSLK